jgi:hypothetical protein
MAPPEMVVIGYLSVVMMSFVRRLRRELGAGKYWLFQAGTSTTSRSITSWTTFLYIHQHSWHWRTEGGVVIAVKITEWNWELSGFMVRRLRRELGVGKYWLFQAGTSTTSRSITSWTTFLYIHQHSWALAYWGRWRCCKNDGIKLRIKRIHGEEVEEGVGGGEVLAVPGGHQHHQPIHHVLSRKFCLFINIAGNWQTEGGGDSGKNNGMKLWIKRIHGEKVEERVGGREVLAAPGGHQHHQPIHHILHNISQYSST